MNTSTLRCINTLLDHTYSDEEKSYCECFDVEDASEDIKTLRVNDPEFLEKTSHIFYDIFRVHEWLTEVEA